MAYKAGKPFSKSEIKKYVEHFKNHHKPLDKEPKNKEEFRRAEYFSREAFEDLLDSGCSGIRIYYGVAPEKNAMIDSNGADMMRRIFIVPVKLNEDGTNTDIEFKPTRSKPDVEGKDSGGGSGGIGEGWPCPSYCSQ